MPDPNDGKPPDNTMRQPTLTTKESLALQAMVRRAGMTAVLEDLSSLCSELTSEDARWQDVADAIYEALSSARKLT
jgi:hypothetical protein